MLKHWHSYYDRLYFPDQPAQPACRLPFDTKTLIVNNIHEVNCERCHLRFQFEMRQSTARLAKAIREGKNRCPN